MTHTPVNNSARDERRAFALSCEPRQGSRSCCRVRSSANPQSTQQIHTILKHDGPNQLAPGASQGESFDEEIFPPSAAGTPSVGAEDWFGGGTAPPTLMSLNPADNGQAIAASAPVSAPQSTRQIWTALQQDGPNHLGLRCN